MLQNKNNEIKKSYDNIGYLSKTFYRTLPYAQKVLMQIFGFETTNLKNARVLEIGCSYGGNILTFALANENSTCIGIDLSSEQIKKGRELVERLGVKNLELLEMDITEFDESLGEFDYIICHGVYSWVSPMVQDGILKVIKRHLSKTGSAIISYNTYPGWKSFDILKDIMNFRVDYLGIEGIDKLAYGKGAMEFIKNTPHLKDIASKVDHLLEKDNYYLYHEYFETFNNPLYFYEFSKKINEYGLSHVSDMNYARSFPILKDESLEDSIEREADGNRVIKEQYYDYYFNTQFRTSLITHTENLSSMNITNSVMKKDLDKLYFRLAESDSDSDFYEKLMKSYPNTLTTEDLGKENEVYKEILLNIYKGKIGIYTESINVDNKIAEKIELKDSYRKYIEYFRDEENPIISFSTFDGKAVFVKGKHEYEIMLMFNGKNTDEDIYNNILEMEKESKININDDKKKEAILDYINGFKIFLLSNLFCK